MTAARPDPGTASPSPLSDLRAFFEGDWAFLRIIEDRKLGLTGSLLGHAAFRPEAGGGLHYRERGRLAFGAHVGPAERGYRYSFPAPGRAEVFFEDGRFFHALELAKGEDRVRHDCPPDLYEGHLRHQGPNNWYARWRITGPRKDLILETWYLRHGGEIPILDESASMRPFGGSP